MVGRELLSSRLYCMPQKVTNGFLYVELNKCGQYSPRRAFLPPEGNWHWISNTQSLVGGVPISAVKYISRVFEKVCISPGGG